MLKKVTFFLLIVLLVALPAQAETIKIFITNDVHGYVEHSEPKADSPGRIGYAYLKGYIKASVADRKFLLDAGDFSMGSVYAKVDYGQGIVKLMGQMDYKYVAYGNREFYYNSALGNPFYPANLLETLRQSQQTCYGYKEKDLCTSISQNIYTTDGKTLRHNETKPVVLYEDGKKGGVRVVVTGITTPATMSRFSAPFLSGLIFGDKQTILSKLEASVQQYDREKDLVLVLSHVGLQEKTEYLSSGDLAKVKNVDIVADAHSHKLATPRQIGQATYVNGGRELEHFVEITIQADGSYLVELVDYAKATQAQPDRDIALAVTKLVEGEAEKVLGNMPQGVVLDNEEGAARYKVTPLGRFIAKVMQEQTGADLAIFPGGSLLKKAALADVVRKKDAYNLFMFLRDVVTIKLTAQELKEMFECKFSEQGIFTEANYGFPQFYGLELELEPREGGGYSVTDIKKDGASILAEPDKEYLLAVTSDLVYGSCSYAFKPEQLMGEVYPDLAAIISTAFAAGHVDKFDYVQISKENLLFK